MNNTNANLEIGATENRAIKSVKAIFRADWPAYRIILAIAFVWFCLAQLATFVFPDTQTNLGESGQVYLGYALRNGMLYVIFFGIFALKQAIDASNKLHKGQSLFVYLNEQLRENFSQCLTYLTGTLLYFGVALSVFVTYLYSYSTIKTRIPNMVPYSWDTAFYKLDNLIFLGKDPWQHFAFLYDYPVIIRAMDLVYDLWAAIMVCVWFFVLRFGGDQKPRRIQYVLTLMLTWFIGGNILAILLSSGGPVYYEALTGLASTYPEQLAQLAAINAETPLRAVPYQEMLWQVYQSPSVGFGGISAMPSMHCASSLLLFLMFGRTKIAKILLGGFFLFILISSFVLGWHYAVDGLLAIPIVYGCWKLSGFIVTRYINPGVPKTAN